VLWRSPARFQKRVVDSAKALGLTQNAYLTTAALLLCAVALDTERPSKESIAPLIEQMNSVKADQNMLCSCGPNEWKRIKQFIDVLEDAGIVTGLNSEGGNGGGTPRTTYTLRFTPEGRAMWHAIGPRIARLLNFR
jgi:hypothetical protein